MPNCTISRCQTRANVLSAIRCALFMLACAISVNGQQTSPYTHPAADPNHDLTVKEFFRDVGGNFVGILDVRNLGPLAVGAAATGLATIPEQDLEQHFARGEMWGAWADPGKYIGNPAILFGTGSVLFAASRKSNDRRFRSMTYSLMQGAIVSSGVVQSTKFAFSRLRPNGENYSFPSGHVSDTFMVATVAADHYGWKAAIPSYAVAAYVSATRLEERKHHLTDVVAAAAIGYVVGKTVTRRMHKKEKPMITWQVYPSGRGAIVTMALNLP